MEKISFIVERLNNPPFNKEINTMTEFDSKSSLELLEYLCEIITLIDPEQEGIHKETTEGKVGRLFQFLTTMKFNIPEDQMEDFQNLLLSGDKDILHTVVHWCLHRFEHLQKKAYVGKFLVPIDIPPEFLYEDLIVELSEGLKQMQGQFIQVHKAADQARTTGARPSELKAEILQLEQESQQLKNKIQRMKKDSNVDEISFKDMLKATCALRKEQEIDVTNHEQLREHRRNAHEADQRFQDAVQRLSEIRNSGTQNQSAEQLLSKLHDTVKDLSAKKDDVEKNNNDRTIHLEKLQGWDKNDRATTDDDVRAKRDQVEDIQEEVSALLNKLEGALERNSKLVVFRQASTIALKKYREREDEVEKLSVDSRRLLKQIEDKENELRAKGKNTNKIGKIDLKKYGAVVREKIEKYKKMREELGNLRSELVVLQRTEQVLKTRHSNLDSFLADLERQKGVEGFRDNQRAMIEMTEKTAEVDLIKGSTLEDISMMVEQISREFKQKQSQLKPLIVEVKMVRGEYAQVENQYTETKTKYDKVAVGLDMDKQTLEKECNNFLEDCLREESRYHYLTNLIAISRIKLERLEQEKKWQQGDGRMMRDFKCFKDLYAHKLTQQEQLTKQLRKRQKELKENSGALTNQKSNFLSLQRLLEMKLSGPGEITQGVPINGMVYTPAYAEVVGGGMGGESKGDREEERGTANEDYKYNEY